jgi:glutamate-1-semialdehyde 2,1-aminomutase
MRKWDTSRACLERARQSLAGGVSSPFRAKAPVPLYFANGCGARLTDLDGNEYIDYLLAWGPAILGHRHPVLVEAMRRQAELPLDYGAQHETEYLVSEKVQSLVPCAERVAVTSSGTEAVQLAHRLARAFTGRNLILKFEGHYHGWADSALVSYHPNADQVGPLDAPHTVLPSRGQVANAAENVVVAPWNRLEILARILERTGSQVAAIMMEPFLCNSGCIEPAAGYLEGVQALARRHGCLLIFDEVITGFRMNLGGAQKHYGVTPDLATFGKAIGGGATLSALGGRKEIVELMVDGGVSFGGSFNGNPVSMACALATLTELSRDDGAPLKQANRLGRVLMEEIRGLARKHGIPLLVTGFGAAFTLHFTARTALTDYRDTLADDPEMLRRFLIAALERGVYPVPDGRFYVSAAHTERDVEETARAIDETFGAL